MIVGCSGDGSVGPNPGTPFIEANGGVPQEEGAATQTRGASEQPQQVQVTVGGGPVDAMLPGGLSVTAGETLAVFDTSEVLIEGLSVAGGGNTAPSRQSAGEIFVRRNGVGQQFSTGVFVLSSGRLSRRFVLPDGMYEVFISGPFLIARGGNRLDIQSFIFHGEVRNGQASIPRTISGQLPINGGSSFPLRLNIQMKNRFSAGYVELKVVHANGILHQDKTLANGSAQFHDLVFSGNSVIPQTGLQTVEFRYSANPIH